MSWPSVPLDDGCSLITDGTHYSPADAGDGVPFLTVKDMTTEGLSFDTAVRITREEFLMAAAGNSTPRLGDVLFSKDGTVGKVHVVSDATEFAVLSSIAILRPKPGILDSTYLGHVLRSPTVLQRATNRKTGSALTRIVLKDLRRVPIPLPPPSEQRRIAAILDKADAVRRKRRESLRLLDEFLRSAYAELLGQENTDYPSWPQLRIAELADDRPDSMRTGPFGSALRHSEFVDKGVAVLGIDNAVRNRFAWGERRFITEEKYEKFKRYTVKAGDVIVTIMGTTGRSAVVPLDVPRAISTKHLAVITVDRSRVHPLFLSQAISSDPTVLAQIAAANRGAIMAGLNLGIIRGLRLRLPPLAAQERFAAVVEGVQRARNRLEFGVRETDHLFNSLAQRAFRGEL